VVAGRALDGLDAPAVRVEVHLANGLPSFTNLICQLDRPRHSSLFSVPSPNGQRAFKATNPALLEGPGGAAEKKRLDLQRKLIGHGCPSLVQTYCVFQLLDAGL